MTEMMYYTYDGNFSLDCEAEVTQCQFIESEKKEEESPQTVQVCLNRTVMHAQGGGQPTDTGTITLQSDENGEDPVSIRVQKVLLDRASNIATHTGVLTKPLPNGNQAFSIGDKVAVKVDADNRQILSECHTAGHVVDGAMAKCGLIPAMDVAKAYHFLDSPYVEYKGKVAPEDREPLLKRLQEAFQALVEQDMPTGIAVLNQEEATKLCNVGVRPDYFPWEELGDEVRMVTVAGWSCPCGGTHVKSTGLLKARRWGVTGLRCKKGMVRIRYNQNWDA